MVNLCKSLAYQMVLIGAVGADELKLLRLLLGGRALSPDVLSLLLVGLPYLDNKFVSRINSLG